MKKTIEHERMVFHFKCQFADGAYYETEDNKFFLLTNAAGEVNLCSNIPHRKNVIKVDFEFDADAKKNRIKESD